MGVGDLKRALLDSSCIVGERLQHDQRPGLVRVRPLSAPERCSRTRSSVMRTCFGSNGNRTISKISPSYVFNTIETRFSGQRQRVTMAMDIGGLGGNTSYLKPT